MARVKVSGKLTRVRARSGDGSIAIQAEEGSSASGGLGHFERRRFGHAAASRRLQRGTRRAHRRWRYSPERCRRCELWRHRQEHRQRPAGFGRAFAARADRRRLDHAAAFLALRPAARSVVLTFRERDAGVLGGIGDAGVDERVVPLAALAARAAVSRQRPAMPITGLMHDSVSSNGTPSAAPRRMTSAFSIARTARRSAGRAPGRATARAPSPPEFRRRVGKRIVRERAEHQPIDARGRAVHAGLASRTMLRPGRYTSSSGV